jgi:hypothetical protein
MFDIEIKMFGNGKHGVSNTVVKKSLFLVIYET